MPKGKKQPIALVPHTPRLPRPSDKGGHHLETSRALDSLMAFEEAVGGRSKLVDAFLGLPELSAEEQLVVGVLADPRFDDRNLAILCKEAGITPGQVFRAYRNGVLAKAHVLAISLAAAQLPSATKDLLEHCVTHEEPCLTCRGLGSLMDEPTEKQPKPESRACWACCGKGIVRVASSLEHQKVMLDLVGLIKKSSGVQVNTQVNLPAASSGLPAGSLEQLQQAVGDILYRDRRASALPTPAADTPASSVVEGVVADASADPAAPDHG